MYLIVYFDCVFQIVAGQTELWTGIAVACFRHWEFSSSETRGKHKQTYDFVICLLSAFTTTLCKKFTRRCSDYLYHYCISRDI